MLIALIIYAAIINAIGFALMGIDKSRAKRGAWRIKEITFFVVSLLGGGLFSWIGMYTFRHKTKHMSFVIGIPLCMLVGLALLGTGFLLVLNII